MTMKRKVKRSAKAVLTAQDVEREMRLCISAARSNPDPVKQKRFHDLFGDRTPTPEEFIRVLTKEVEKEKQRLAEENNEHDEDTSDE